MKKIIFNCLGLVTVISLSHFVSSNAVAGVYQDCSPCDVAICDPCAPVGCDRDSLWECGGWAEAGLYVNEYGQKNSYDRWGLIPESGNTELLRNVRQSDPQLNQLWLYFGKKLDTRFGWDFGGRIDGVFGTDAYFLQSDGLEYKSGTNREWRTGDYYTALAQIYGEVGYKNVSLKVGKFLSPLMGESIMSPNRFFYSLPRAFDTTAVTNSGALATWKVNDAFSLYGGWVNGADSTFANSNDNAALFGFDWRLNRSFKFGYAGMIGKDKSEYSDMGMTMQDYRYYVHSFHFNWQMSQRWNYQFQWQLRNDSADARGFGRLPMGTYYGINNEFVYTLNQYWSFGIRAEWWHRAVLDDEYDSYEVTLGANWTPNRWLTIRPEIRMDKIDGASPFSVTKGNNLTNMDHQLSGGVSAVVKF